LKPDNITNTDWKILKEKYPDSLEEVLKKLNNHYPIQYLIGDVDFYDCKIMVNENVLIPRFETELMVEKIISYLQKQKQKDLNIIDLGTGSGCIAIALKKNINANLTAIDISKKALDLAQKNAKINQVNINFKLENIENVSLEKYQIIISNPPYVTHEEPVGEETKYEPNLALFAQEEGTYFYRKILENIQKNDLQPELIVFEIGMNQGVILTELCQKYLPTYQIKIEKDYQQRDRFAWISKKNLR